MTFAGCRPGPLNPPKMGSQSPLNMPMKGSDVDAGPGSLEAVHRQLEGTWVLTSFDIYPQGKRQRVSTTGDLTYDAYGNLTIRGELQRPGTGADAHPLLLNYSGRAVIDVPSRELRLLDVAAAGDTLPRSISDPVSAVNVRHYDLNGTSLTLTAVDAKGQVTAVSTWTKRAPEKPRSALPGAHGEELSR
jgi:hypothetical protein